MTNTLIVIDEVTVKRLAKWDWIIDAVEDAFVSLASNAAEAFPTVLGKGSETGTVVGAKSGLIKASASSEGKLGLKLGTYWPVNPNKGLAAHGSTTLLLDDKTGFPKAIINAHYLNGMRTAAANAVAAKYLSAPDARTLAIFGAGNQARFEVESLRQVRDIQQVTIVNRDHVKADAFAKDLIESGIEARVCDAETAVKEAQLITTVTAARAPLFESQWVSNGTHISAMGSDTPEKQEIPTSLFEYSKLYCDSHSQSIRIGEFQYATEEQKAKLEELGHTIATGNCSYSSNNITIFDSSGIGLQDVSVAGSLLEQATQQGLIKTIPF